MTCHNYDANNFTETLCMTEYLRRMYNITTSDTKTVMHSNFSTRIVNSNR